LVEGASILQAMAPAAVEAVLKAKNGNRGFTLQDSVAMVAAIENLVLRESQVLLETVYTKFEEDYGRILTRRDLYRVLAAYALLFENQAFEADLFYETQNAMRNESENNYIVRPVRDAIMTFDYRRRNSISPFSKRAYKWEDVLRLTLQIHRGYGREFNHQCLRVKSTLMDLGATGTGRVFLHDFYKLPSVGEHSFEESKEYLRSSGVLDESVPSVPRVMIANYIYGPTNCLVNSGYFSLCCISMCEKLMAHLEKSIQAPSAEPKRILEIMNHSIPFHDEIQISDALASKLHIIAERNQDAVPIYGRLFSQWMHFAFPTECPYPSVLENSSHRLPSAWKVPKDQVLETAAGRRAAQSAASVGLSPDDVLEHMWDDLEIAAMPKHGRNKKVINQVFLVAAAVAMGVCSIMTMARHTKGMIQHLRTSKAKCEKHMV